MPSKAFNDHFDATLNPAPQTHDLGLGWFVNLHADGSMTIRNIDQGRRFDLSIESARRLREICRAA